MEGGRGRCAVPVPVGNLTGAAVGAILAAWLPEGAAIQGAAVR